MLPLRRHHCSPSLFIGGFPSTGPASSDLIDGVIRLFAILTLAHDIYGHFREFKNNVSCYSFSTFIEETTGMKQASEDMVVIKTDLTDPAVTASYLE